MKGINAPYVVSPSNHRTKGHNGEDEKTLTRERRLWCQALQ